MRNENALQLVIQANAQFKLSELFKELKIAFQQNYHSRGWTHKRNCPFPDHQETAPSFFFNPEEERFHCFGCNRNGKIVQFLSFLNQKPTSVVAKELFEKTKDGYQPNFNIENLKEHKDIQIELFKFVIFFSQWCEKNKKHALFAQNLMEVFETYLKNNLSKQKISLNELKSRINFCHKKLKEFECLENC